MVFRLETETVFDYLLQQGVGHLDASSIEIEPKLGKNFNLLVRLSSPHAVQPCSESFLVKQEPFDHSEGVRTALRSEWSVYALLRSCTDLYPLQALVSDAVRFDDQNGILIYRFLERYQDLDEFYTQAHQYPTAIAAALGITLATIHQATFDRLDYRQQLDPESAQLDPDEEEIPDFRESLEQLTPDIFKRVSVDGLKFYELYQRYDSLGQAIAQLEEDYESCCLIHNDLKFNNILLHDDWAAWIASPLPTEVPALQLSDQQGVLRLIDWEKWQWGDPALDVGAIAAEYLKVWLKSLMLSRDIEMEVALRLAATPLETLQPSLAAFLQAYLAQFPQVLTAFPDFVERVLRFTGLALIESIQARLHYREPFGNIEICMLQVAKSLLCNPQAAVTTVFGQAEFHAQAFAPETVIGAIANLKEEQDERLTAQVSLPDWVRDYSLEKALADLVENVSIQSSTIAHPAYTPLDMAHNASDRYQHLPATLRQTYLMRQVRNYVYDIYFSGEQEQRAYSVFSEASQPAQKPELKNNAVAGLDIDFYEQMQAANTGSGFLDPDWIVSRREAERLQVMKDGLHLWVNPTVDLEQQDAGQLSVGSAVSLRLPNAQLTGDFYTAIANVGEPSPDEPCLELYFNTTPEGAIALMKALTLALNRRAYSFTFKILTDPADYGRYDAAVLRIERLHYGYVHGVLQEVYSSVRSHLHDPIPLFTKRLAPGIGLAEDPEDGNEFGLSRCQLVAEVLRKSDDPAARLKFLHQQFTQHQLDWQCPYLNFDSGDLYPTLDTDVPYLTL